MKIHSPAKGYTGTDRYGSVVLEFKDGVAEFDGDLPSGVRQYLKGAGYGLGSAKAVEPETPEPADPREIGDGVVGTRLRDAAVDPKPDDFLAPINAGEANPHGPNVVSPEIHASGPAGIRPGQVFIEDPDKQETREKAYAEARLIDQVPAAEAVRAEIGDVTDFGPLGLSDPGSVQQGVEGAKEVAKTEAIEEKAAESETLAPAKKAASKTAPAKKTTAKKAAAKKS